MKRKFLGEDFLLSNEISQKLYDDYAKDMPIIDYHCHISPEEIATNKKFKNITEVWLYGDHYKWRQMRSNGIDEKYITGNASDYEKFYKWAETLEKAIGNPLYHWSHLELKRYFGYSGHLCTKTAKEVWDLCEEKLAKTSAIEIVKMSNVKFIGTTDDPIDDLKWHKMIKENKDIDFVVAPSFRPEKAMAIENPNFISYIKSLEIASEMQINSYSELKTAIAKRIEYFNSVGCKASDHSLDYVMYADYTEEEIEEIFAKRFSDKELTFNELIQFKTAFLAFVAGEYKKYDWAMQLHYGCKRNNNTTMFNEIGVDTGFDCISNNTPSAQLADFLNHVQMKDALPKTILYSLNPNDDEAIGSIIGCFQEKANMAGKIQHGSAWWFNDTKTGMIKQMTSLANLGLLGNFIGMLTDSRSFLSYTRHEYFRRILCELVGSWVYNGEFPEDYDLLENLIKNISYNNAKNYFGI